MRREKKIKITSEVEKAMNMILNEYKLDDGDGVIRWMLEELDRLNGEMQNPLPSMQPREIKKPIPVYEPEETTEETMPSLVKPVSTPMVNDKDIELKNIHFRVDTLLKELEEKKT